MTGCSFFSAAENSLKIYPKLNFPINMSPLELAQYMLNQDHFLAMDGNKTN